MGIVATFPEHTEKLSRKSQILHYLMQEKNAVHQIIDLNIMFLIIKL